VGAQRDGVGRGRLRVAAEGRSADLGRLAARADGGAAVGVGQRVAAGRERAGAVGHGVVAAVLRTAGGEVVAGFANLPGELVELRLVHRVGRLGAGGHVRDLPIFGEAVDVG